MERMVPIAASGSVTVFSPEDGRFSFFNSPYHMHFSLTGVDIYPERGFGEIAPAPVEGRVVKIRKVRSPRGRGFRDDGFDCVILLESLEDPGRVVKILHVDPAVDCGEVVKPGQPLGRLLRSGYFNFWTDPHIHLEVRRPSDPFRARGGFTLRRLLAVDEPGPVEELRGTVTRSTPEYALIALREKVRIGLPVDVGGRTGLLDGGIPHYGRFGVHMRGPVPCNSPVRLCGEPIGMVKTARGDMGLAECADFSFEVDGVEVGLSLYLSPASEPKVKLIPPKRGMLKLEESEEVSLTIGRSAE